MQPTKRPANAGNAQVKHRNPTYLFNTVAFLFLFMYVDPLRIGVLEYRYIAFLVVGVLLRLGVSSNSRSIAYDKTFFQGSAFLLIWMMISASMSKRPEASFPVIAGILFVYIFSAFWLPKFLGWRQFLYQFAKVFIFFNVVFFIASILGIRHTGRYLASNYVYANPAMFGQLVLLMLMIKFLLSKNSQSKIFNGIGAVCVVAIIAINGQKSIVVIALIYLALLVYVYSRTAAFSITAMIATVVFALLLSPELNRKFQDFAPMYSRGKYMEFSTGRVDRYLYQYEVWKLNPIFGVGFNQPELRLAGPSASMVSRAGSHNSYLTFLAETGLFGGIVFLLLIAHVATKLLSYLNNIRSVQSNNWPVVFWTIYIFGLLVQSLFEGTLSGLGYGGTMFWLVTPSLLLGTKLSNTRLVSVSQRLRRSAVNKYPF